MREIKFRIYDKIINKMLLESELNSIRLTCFGSIVEDSFYVNESILMQYTGIKDKDGKEIYEGDIIKSDCFRDGGQSACYDNNIYKVKYIDYGFFSIDEDDYNLIQPITEDTYYVIGNIYENPELLEG